MDDNDGPNEPRPETPTQTMPRRLGERDADTIERLQRELAEVKESLEDARFNADANRIWAEKAERERDEALAAIRNAPHGMGCHSLQAEFQHTAGWASLEYCDCWKRAILDAAREVEK